MNVIEKLKEFGIITKNTYPKKTFINNENVVIKAGQKYAENLFCLAFLK